MVTANDRELEYQALRQFLKTMENPKTRLMTNLAIALEEELTEKQRMAVQCYYIKQMPMKEIAEHMEVHISTVSRTLKRARAFEAVSEIRRTGSFEC